MPNEFESKLKFGKVAESAIAKWLMQRGNHVLPAYEIIEQKFQGPQLFGLESSYVTPDMLVFGNKGAIWIEAKHKTAFTWHRISQRFVTGIDNHHWKHYQEVARITGLQCWLMFNHIGGQAKDSPPSPEGLFGGEISKLKACVNHVHQNHGRHGMVYWAIGSLVRFGPSLTTTEPTLQ